MYLRYVNYTGRAYESGYDVGVTPEQFIEAWKTTLDYVLEKNQDGQRVVEQQTAYLLGNILAPSHAYMCLRRPCGCGMSQVTVGHDGTIHVRQAEAPCQMNDERGSNT